MSEAPSITERYITGTGKVVGTAAMACHVCHGDMAATTRLGVMLWGVMYEGKTGEKHRLAELLGDHLNRQMGRDRRLKGDAWKIAREMLAWHCEGICTACEGRGYEVIQGTPSLSDNICHHCHGTGKRPYTREASHVWMEAELSRMTALAAGEVMKRLRTDMEL